MLKLKKTRPETEDYDPMFCCEAKCSRESEVIVSSRKRAIVDLPLCDFHWEAYCELKEEGKNEIKKECEACRKENSKEATKDGTI